MYNEKIKRENEILKLAVEAFKKNVPLQVNIETPLNLVDYDHGRGHDYGYDMELNVDINGKHLKYYIETRNMTTKANKMLLVMKKQGLRYPLLLAVNYVNPNMADELKKENIEFIDTTGNAFINQPPIYIFIKGNRLPENTRQIRNRAFQQKGLKIIYALLCNPGLENKTFRTITATADAALGTVVNVIRDLKELGFLIDMGEKGYKLLNKDKLLQRWVTDYAERLRPKLILGRYKGEQFGWWQNKQLDILKAKWGGEVAAAKLTKYLHPEIVTIYTNEEYLPQLLLDCKLKKDPNGEVEILEQFEKHEVNLEYGDLVHPILIYADLLATGNQRNTETAKMIYDEHIVRLIRED